MSRKIFYNIHNIIKIEINTNSKTDFLKDINFFLSYFEVENVSEPDIILNIGKFLPCNNDCYLVDHKYHIRENYFYCKDKEGRAKWEVEILGFEEGKAVINFYSKILGIEQILIPDYLAQNLILRPLIELKLLERGYIVIHGLGLERNNRAIMAFSRGGGHKTRTIMNALKSRRWKLVGDDRLILKEKWLYSYPLFYKSVLFRANKLNSEEISGLFTKIKFFHSMNSKKGFQEESTLISRGAELVNIYQIFRIDGNEKIELKHCSKKQNSFDIPKKILNSSKIEMTSSGIKTLGFVNFYKYMSAYSYIFPNGYIDNYWNIFKQELKKELQNFEIVELALPEKYSNKILELYEELLFSENKENNRVGDQ